MNEMKKPNGYKTIMRFAKMIEYNVFAVRFNIHKDKTKLFSLVLKKSSILVFVVKAPK